MSEHSAPPPLTPLPVKHPGRKTQRTENVFVSKWQDVLSLVLSVGHLQDWDQESGITLENRRPEETVRG